MAAFAAVLENGTVVAWGHPSSGSIIDHVQEQLRGVKQIQASENAFAALLADGSVVTWGSKQYGGDSAGVQHRLRNVQQIQASGNAFAAVRDDGSLVLWGGTVAWDVDEFMCTAPVRQIQASGESFLGAPTSTSEFWGSHC